MADLLNLGISIRFHVSIGGIDLGAWKSCKGLNVNFKSSPQWSGGNYGAPEVLLADKLEYSNITLVRAMDPVNSATVQAWLRDKKTRWLNCYANPGDSQYHGETGTIKLLDSSLNEVISWNLTGVYPAKWSGPDLDAMGSAAVALETLELVHLGFL